MNTIDQAMMMSAGLGTRLKPYTDVCPKPLLPLLGVPLLEWVALQAAAQGVKRLVANVHHLSEKMIAEAPRLMPEGTTLTLSDETQKLLGSAGGIAKALPLFNQKPFFLLNSDVIVEADFSAMSARHEELKKSDGILITLGLRKQSPTGAKYRQIFTDEKTGLITQLGELQESCSFYAGVAILEHGAVSHLPQNEPSEFVPDVLRPALAKNQVAFHWLPDHGIWEDIGEPALWWRAHGEVIRRWRAGLLNPVWKKRLEQEYELHADGVFPVGTHGPTHQSPRTSAFWNGLGPLSALEDGGMVYGPLRDEAASSAKKWIAYQGIVRSFA